MVAVTTNQIRARFPCVSSWRALLQSLWKTQADDEPISFDYILDVLGVADALWALRALPAERDREVRLLVCDIVEPALRYTIDQRVPEALRVARAYARGETTEQDCRVAWYLAQDAALEARQNRAREEAAIAVRYTASRHARFAAVDAARCAASAAAYHVRPRNDEAWVEVYHFVRADQAHILREWSESNR